MKTKIEPTNRIEQLNGNGHAPVISSREVQIKAPNFQTAVFHIKGTAPLVICRFSKKDELLADYEKGTQKGKGKKVYAPTDLDNVFEEAKYISKDGWEGFNASSIRNGLIRVCTLVNFKMTLAKMSLFVIEDGRDAKEHQMPLVRIYGESIRQDDSVRNPNTGKIQIATRAAYHNWSAKLNIRWDADQFSLTDVSNLLMRVGVQCGIGCGRPFSTDSVGMGWGTFEIFNNEELK